MDTEPAAAPHRGLGARVAAALSGRGVRLRATVAATAAVAVALCLVSAVLVAGLRGSLERSARAEADSNARAVAAKLEGGPPAGASQVKNGDVQVLPSPRAGMRAWRGDGGYVVVDKPVDTPQGLMVVQARASLAPTEEALRTLRALLLPGIPALLLLVAWLTWTTVGRALNPVSAIRREVADITAHGLHRRVPEPGSDDEVAALARTMNATLDRLQAAIEQHKQFVADAAHELRSPLAVLHTRLELAAPRHRPLAAEALTDVVRLQRLSADLLLLARLDAGEPRPAREVDLSQVVAEEAARTRPRPEVRVDLAVEPDVVLRGSADQMRRLVANLVDNAVRHAESAVAVRLTTGRGGGSREARIEVVDDGPGIPEEHRDTVFRRFARLDEARARDSGGSGLGLAIARDIAAAHGGTLALAASEAGTGARFRARLPVG
ncbi:HAMP domain-containing sensor histidine kinase [Streptomyces sp. B1866]|uniref:sensor histidine kinase n=1 Tax=Streptomyces sp. B1866 TaxID=3075431 RepID=UPI0028918A25|nr:HAMP domain-containing sensor histidine kinase [Streptomyces sp. B1866]MDT3396548.1 HAMP domain-containing sensor histidine kinase [Streptomyces sp. B1866]